MLNSLALVLPTRHEHYTAGREIFTCVGSSEVYHILSNCAFVIRIVCVVCGYCVSPYTSSAGREICVMLLRCGYRFVVILNVV